jgi:hypothetical protein
MLAASQFRQMLLDSFCFRGSRGSDPRLLRLTMSGLLDRHIWGATPCIKDRRRPKVRPTQRYVGMTKLDPLAGKIRTNQVVETNLPKYPRERRYLTGGPAARHPSRNDGRHTGQPAGAGRKNNTPAAKDTVASRG